MDTHAPAVSLPRVDIDKLSWSAPWLSHLGARFAQDTPALWSASMDTRSALNFAVAILHAHGLPMKTGLGKKLKFIPQDDLPSTRAYEEHIALTGGVPTRLNLHDFFNACVWLTFPLTKAVLNARQYEQIQTRGIKDQRGAARDALTIFDENAAILVTSDPQRADALRGFGWHNRWGATRDLWDVPFNPHPKARAAAYLFGHALMEKLTEPRKAMCAHAWVVLVNDEWFAMNLVARMADLDTRLAAQLAQHAFDPHDFCPLPILGVPHFWQDNRDSAFYNDTTVFRAGRMRELNASKSTASKNNTSKTNT